MSKEINEIANLNHCTPPDLFAELDAEFRFTLDAAASQRSAKCSRYYTPETNGLDADWAGETVFCNPPYGAQITEWVRKGYEEGQKPETTVVMLLPSRTDTAYFHDHLYNKAEIRFLRGRIHFLDEDGNELGRANTPSLIAIFRGPRETSGGIKEIVTSTLKDKELTANELTDLLQASGYTYDRGTVSPCLTKLKAAGVLKTAGKRPCTKTGKMAVVWTAVEK